MKDDHAPYRPEAATDEPASPANPNAEREGPAFASEAEQAAYRAGVADGMRNAGGRVHPDMLDFDPVPTRHRFDGITPAKQREYVEALADTGVARCAAARIGVSEQAINRLRRRADAASFNLACEAARRIGARRLHALAWERAVEGTIKRHYYHGELKSEERVYDNRLLIYLLGKTEHLIEPPEESAAVVENWQPWVEAIEQGLPAPDLAPQYALEPEPDEEEEFEFTGGEVWEDEDGIWWTRFPPSESFFGHEEGVPGDDDYRRTLSGAEMAVVEAEIIEKREAELARECERRDAWFGFEGDPEDEEIFSPMEPEPCETSEPPRHCEERSDAAIQRAATPLWIASLRSQ